MSQEEKKKPNGILDRFAEKVGFVRKSQKPATFFEEVGLADGSVRIIQDSKLRDRIAAMEILIYATTKPLPANMSLKARTKELRTRLDSLQQCIQQIAAPYARSSDIPKMARLLWGWNKMYGCASSYISRAEIYFVNNDVNTEKDSDSSIVVNDLEFTLVQHIFPDAFSVLDYCFSEKDVRPQAVTVLQSMVPPNPNSNSSNINKSTEDM